MSLSDDLTAGVKAIFKDTWDTRKGQKVPDPEDLKLGNDAIEFEKATILYADLSGSTNLVNSKSWWFAAEIYKTYLLCAAKIIRAESGAIVSYDGDRVMGIWVGSSQSRPAVRCGLKINYAVQNIVNPALKARYTETDYELKQVVGIDVSAIRAARTGVRGGNDLVWVGRAANYAAKLTELNLEERTWITKEVYDRLNDKEKVGGSPARSMWKSYNWTQQGGHSIYGSTWLWEVDK
ncbi:adenylate/guanylate cyclase domain-containing protein [Roseomonas mucosa]|uniref:adenylate/guanylate cyclase domain-containing protein n=1 Tax=Roseomonas mucosa TaxID=207340 RepID=UPI00123C211A|nr:adenylate/guanylate cyclase domain-containing protein [Roseomonas mucosa]QET91484.1 adenylate/guanylate cyclase domain-containing protein [Roseomonas mucosa]